MNRITQININKIKENYFQLGTVGCHNKFNIPKGRIRYIAEKYKLKYNHELTYKNNANLELFRSIDREDVSYFIGLMFADGCFFKKGIRIEFTKTDYEFIKNIFPIIGKWSIKYRQRKRWKEQVNLTMGSTKLASIFKEKEFKGNNFNCLNYIKKELWPFFFRGLSDGDGCWSGNKNCFSISSCYNFDWSIMENLLKELDIKYSLSRRIYKNGTYSTIVIHNMKDSIKWGKYIYKDIQIHNFCFSRKFYKFISCIKYYIQYLHKLNHEGFYKDHGRGFIWFQRKDCNFRKYGIKDIEHGIKIREQILKEQYPHLLNKYLYSDIIEKEQNFIKKIDFIM